MTSVKPEYEKFESPKAIVESSTLTVDEKYSLLTIKCESHGKALLFFRPSKFSA